jgi:hypothetical protein
VAANLAEGVAARTEPAKKAEDTAIEISTFFMSHISSVVDAGYFQRVASAKT